MHKGASPSSEVPFGSILKSLEKVKPENFAKSDLAHLIKTQLVQHLLPINSALKMFTLLSKYISLAIATFADPIIHRGLHHEDFHYG